MMFVIACVCRSVTLIAILFIGARMRRTPKGRRVGSAREQVCRGALLAQCSRFSSEGSENRRSSDGTTVNAGSEMKKSAHTLVY